MMMIANYFLGKNFDFVYDFSGVLHANCAEPAFDDDDDDAFKHDTLKFTFEF